MFPKYRWRILGNPSRESCASRDPSLLARVLSARGLVDIQAMAGSAVMPDLDIAVGRLRAAGRSAEIVYVHGDYDVDGLTSTAIMRHALERVGARVICRIPDREADGYGLSQAAVMEAKSAGASLIVAVDCGTSDVATVASARSLGLDVVIIDHHMVHGGLPAALAIVNPQREDHDIPFRHLAAAGVCYLVAQAMLQGDAQYLGDLAAMGTIADVMPLVDINRRIVTDGLNVMSHSPRHCITALAEAARLRLPLSSRDVAFGLAPRLNAAGRMGNASRALDLLLSATKDEARQHAIALEAENRARQELEQVMLREALESIEMSGFPVAVIARQGWRRGLLGLVAGRLCDSLGRPAAAVSIDCGIGRGSVRSTSDFDVFRALSACGKVLTRFGGHSRAGGFDVQETDIPAFVQLLSETSLGYVPRPPELVVDTEVTLDELTTRSVSMLSALEPCGEGNPRPNLLLRSVEVASPRKVGGTGQHLKFTARSAGCSLDCIWFGAGTYSLPRGPVDLVVEPSVSEYGGKTTVELTVRDMRPVIGESREYGRAASSGVEITTIRKTPRSVLEAHLTRGGRQYEVWADNPSTRVEAIRRVLDLVVEAPPRNPDALRQAVQQLEPNSRVILNFSGDDIESALSSMQAYAPDRECLAGCYRALQPSGVSVDEYSVRLAERGVISERLAPALAETAITVFGELQLVRVIEGRIVVDGSGKKVDLGLSPTFTARQAEAGPMVEFYSRMCHSVGVLMEWLTA